MSLLCSFAHSQQRRFLCIAATRPLRCSIGGEAPLSIPQLRDLLRRQLQDDAPRMQSIHTAARLAITLSRSPRPADQQEALEKGEALWRELCESPSPIPLSSRTGLRVSLCAAMRRGALVAGAAETAERWTQRFAQRGDISPEDFTTGQGYRPGDVLGWREARRRPQPGTGIDEEDIAADEEEERAQRAKENTQESGPEKSRTPMQQLRRDVFMDHPMMQRAFGRGPPPPGPRYTG